jgi:hypothetical protein
MTMMMTKLFPVHSVQRTAWLLTRLKAHMVLACLDMRWMLSLLLLALVMPAACLWCDAC